MSKKRFTYLKASKNNYIGSFFCNDIPLTNQEVIDLLNESEQLKQAYTQLKHRHSLLHDVCLDAECDRDSYRKDIVSLEKMLDNAANYVQREHREIPLDDFVEWWNNIITEGLDD